MSVPRGLKKCSQDFQLTPTCSLIISCVLEGTGISWIDVGFQNNGNLVRGGITSTHASRRAWRHHAVLVYGHNSRHLPTLTLFHIGNYYIESRTNWPHLADSIFKCIFFNENFWVSNKIETCFWDLFYWHEVSIGLGNGLAPNRRLVITWTNVDLDRCRHIPSGPTEL